MALSANAHAYEIDRTSDRLASWIGQCCHESMGFTQLNELGGPDYFRRHYEGSAALGNTQSGDGARFHGRGLIQLTGRANYRRYGAILGFDLLAQPERVATPPLAVMTALEFWKQTGLNAYADRRDWTGMTRRINGGTKGLAERVALIEMARGLLA
jgi:putative chitinase